MLPEELYDIQQYITLTIDVNKINDSYFLTTVSLYIIYSKSQYHKRLTAVELANLLKEAIQIYVKVNISVKVIREDYKFQWIPKVKIQNI